MVKRDECLESIALQFIDEIVVVFNPSLVDIVRRPIRKDSGPRD
jgi:hypothetical protein